MKLSSNSNNQTVPLYMTSNNGELYEYSGDYYRPEDIEEMLSDIESE